MKTQYIRLFAIAMAAAVLSSCNLDLFPKDSIAYDEDKPLFQTKIDVDGFGKAIYVDFRAIQGGSQYVAEELMLDGFNATKNYGNNYGSIHCLDNSFTSGDQYVESVWANNYLAIMDYNIVIAEAKKVEDESLISSARAIQGDAYFARAFSYLTLARHFGPAYDAATAETALCVPLVLVYNQNEKPSRATVKQVYDQIKADLDSALVIMTENDAKGKVASETFTVDAVKAMLARWYLDTQDYENAFASATEVISTGTYALSDSLDAFQAMYETDDNTEAILQPFVSINETPNSISSFTSLTSTSLSSTKYAYNPLYIPSQVTLDRYSVNDLRYRVWFDNTTKEHPLLCEGAVSKGVVIFTKYEGNADLSSSGLRSGLSAPKPLKIGEMYLIAAEAAFMNDQQEDATTYLKTLQTKRGAKPSKKASLEAIQEEWLRETICEGLTLNNYKRWQIGYEGRPAQELAITRGIVMEGPSFMEKALPAGDYHFVWPIPAYEMKINKNLVQNEGYGTK